MAAQGVPCAEAHNSDPPGIVSSSRHHRLAECIQWRTVWRQCRPVHGPRGPPCATQQVCKNTASHQSKVTATHSDLVETHALSCSLLLFSKNSVVTFLSGVSTERLIKYHRWFAYLLVIPMTIHGWSYKALLSNWVDQFRLTGNIAYCLYLGIVVTSLPPIRRYVFEFFYYSHLVLFTALAVAVIIHAPSMFAFAGLGTALCLLDVYIRQRRARQVHTPL
jgi:Ferric reductase like transmembrane component